ncbi:hypothetical protein NC315_04485 [Streptomyces sp. G2]|uniref:hypothetical protein n=1 Tax=Streptomyces sp. G2 TaxID=1684471 RepID=UPI00203066AC|nr:hypothetical protein [Streptomyces sp. G2]MCM1944631.1 hypothetical protein [Streptomyces sp. G2]
MRPTPVPGDRLPLPGVRSAAPGSATGLRPRAGDVRVDDRAGPLPPVPSPIRPEPAGSVSPNRLDPL